MIAEATVWDALREVHDPEIPTISLVDLGIVHSVEVDDDRVKVRPRRCTCGGTQPLRIHGGDPRIDLSTACDLYGGLAGLFDPEDGADCGLFRC